MITHVGNNKTLAKLFFSYLIILIMPLIFGLTMSEKITTTLKNDEEQKIEQNLSQVQESLDSRLLEVERISKQISENGWVNSLQFVDNPFEMNNVFELMSTSDHLYDYTIDNSFINGYFVFYKKNGIAINDSQIYTIDNLYSQALTFSDWSLDHWKDITFNDYPSSYYLPSHNVTFNGTPGQL